MDFSIKIKYKELFLIILFIPLFLISSFRNGLGTDYYSYANSYLNPDTWTGEYLFKFFFISIPRLISENEITFFIITSFILNYFFLKTICRDGQLIPLAVFIYITQFYFISFNNVRQFLAISLFFYFYPIFINKRIIFYFLFIFFLAQIHYFLYLLFLFPIFGKHDYPVKTYWMIWGGSLILFLLQSYNYFKISSLFWFAPSLVFISDKFLLLNDAAAFFFDKYSSNYQLILKNLFCLMFLLRVIHFKLRNHIYWFNLFLFGTFISNLLVKFSLYSIRVAYIGDVAMIILLPIYITSFKNKWIRFFLTFFFFIYFFVNFYYRFVLMGESEVFMQHSQNWLPNSK